MPHGNHAQRTPRRRAAAALTAAAAGLLLAASPAAADSIAYVKDGDVWLSTTDGSRQYRVTSDGGYSTVSQADNGRLVALRGTRIRHLERDGSVIADIGTPVSNDDPTMSFRGPFEPEISPNGKRVSYTYYWQYKGYDPYCNPSNGCYVQRLYHGTAFTDPNRLTAWDEAGFQRQSGWIYGSWVDDDTVLLSDPSVQPNEDVVLASPNSKDGFRRWFVDHEYYGTVTDATISRDRSAMATVTAGGASMSILRSEGLFHPGYPVRCYEATAPAGGDGAQFASPTFNANGTRLYWAEGDGVHAVTLPKFGAGDCGTLADEPRLVVPGGSNPAWGPADVPPPRPATPPTDTPAPPRSAPTPITSTPGGAAGTGSQARLSAGRVSLRVALRRGIAVRITGAQPGRHALAVRLGRTKVASGTARIAADGRGRATLRFTRTGRRKLAGRQTAALTLTGAGARLTVTLKR